MDPFTLSTSIFGLLKATAQVAQYLAPYVAAARDTPKIVTQVHSEVVYSRTILLALEGFTKNLASIPVKRAALIEVDQLVAVFTDGVLLFSELEASLPSLPPTEPTSPRIPLQTRLQWASKESAFVALLTRLQSFKVSISSMLIILQSDSDLRAEVQHQELLKNVATLLETNQSLSRRLMNLEDAFEVQTIASKRHSKAFNTTDGTKDIISKLHQLKEPIEDGTINKSNNTSQLSTPPEGIEVSSFDFENDLETSRPYRRAQRDTMDFSFRSSIAHTNAWSQFSGLSLSKVSIISAIALPLYPDEIENAQHYGLGREQTLATTKPTPYAPRVRPFYENCLEVEMQLSQIPGFPDIFAEERENSDAEDQLSILILVLRQGVPLLMLLEQIPGTQSLAHLTQFTDYIDEQKKRKVATFRFIKACMNDLGFQPDECFLISDLYGDDTTGFVKVVKVVTRLLDMLTGIGCLEPVDLATILPQGERRTIEPSPRDIIIEGFLVDERSYLANLERLLELKSKIKMDVILYNDTLTGIFGSLNLIVDLQRRLLISMEMTARKPYDKQNWRWARHFETWSSISSTYATFVTSEKGAKEFIRTVLAQPQRVEYEDLNSALSESLRLLYLPSQRLPKYSEFLQGLLRQSELSNSQKQDVSEAFQYLQSALRNINAAIKDQELHEAQGDLVARVQDWRHLNINQFGKLLLFDVTDILNGKSGVSKAYHVYLFEKIFLCCRGGPPARKPTRNLIFRRAKNTESDSGTELKIKGRILASSFTDIVAVSKPGSYSCQIWWKADSEPIENFTMKLPTESKMKIWSEELERVREIECLADAESTPPDFTWMRDDSRLIPNPYAEYSDDEDTDNKDMRYPAGTPPSTPPSVRPPPLLRDRPLLGKEAPF